MRATSILAIVILLGTAAAAVPPVPDELPRLPTCDPPAPHAACVNVLIGNLVVLPGEQRNVDNGTWVWQASVEVQAGGTLLVLNATIAFAQQHPITVDPGGRLVIESSALAGAPGAPPLIDAAGGAHVEIDRSNFTAADVQLVGSDVSVTMDDFRQGNPALKLTDFNGSLANGDTFEANTIALNVTGGHPQLEDLQFVKNTQSDIELFRTAANVTRAQTSQSNFAIRSIQSHGAYESLALMEDELPPTRGIFLQSSDAKIYVNDTDITSFGVGIECHDSDYDANNVNFANNGADQTDDDCSGSH